MGRGFKLATGRVQKEKAL